MLNYRYPSQHLLNHKKPLAFGIVCLIIALAYLYPYQQMPTGLPIVDEEHPLSRPPISYRSTTEHAAAPNLRIPPEETSEARSAMKFFNGWMNDAVFRTFFYYTYEFFDYKPEAFPAARFVSLTLLFDESADNFYLMKWTQADLKRYSDQIMTTLESKCSSIDANPYFHNRMLNLVNQLDIPRDRRIAFLGDTIQRPIVLLKNGELDDSSHNFETALVLAQQEDETGNTIVPYIQRLIESTPGTAELAEIKVRVETFFPQLRWMFTRSGQT